MFLIDTHLKITLLIQRFPTGHAHEFSVLARLPREGIIKTTMDAEQELREYQREYLDFLDDGVSVYFSFFFLCTQAILVRYNVNFVVGFSVHALFPCSGRSRGVSGSCARAHTFQLSSPRHQHKRPEEKERQESCKVSRRGWFISVLLKFISITFTLRLLNEAQLEILAFQRALKECVLSVDDAYGKSFEEFYVGFEGR